MSNARLTVTSSTISGNSARHGGGGIYGTAMLTVTGSTISGNSAGCTAAASVASACNLDRHQQHDQRQLGRRRGGGGISALSTADHDGDRQHDQRQLGRRQRRRHRHAGNVTVTDSTISGNSAGRDGGGICAGGTLTVTDSTISGNSAGGDGGGIYNIRHSDGHRQHDQRQLGQ